MTRSEHRFESIGPVSGFERVLAALQDALQRGELQPGEKLPSEPELAAQFGVSRSVLREALKSLQGRGMLAVRRGYGGGTFVVDRAPAEFARVTGAMTMPTVDPRELLDVRLAIETTTAAMAARAPDRGSGELERAIERVDDAERRPAVVLAAAVEFHVVLARLSGNRLFAAMLDGLRPAMRTALGEIVHDARWRERCRREHTAIAELVARGDPDGAAGAMRDHLVGRGRSRA